jgi:hypothetical protein
MTKEEAVLTILETLGTDDLESIKPWVNWETAIAYRARELEISPEHWTVQQKRRTEIRRTAARLVVLLEDGPQDPDIQCPEYFIADLRTLSTLRRQRGARPKARAINELICSAADIYRQRTGKSAGYGRLKDGTLSGPFWRFAHAVLAYGGITATDGQLARAIDIAKSPSKKT